MLLRLSSLPSTADTVPCPVVERSRLAPELLSLNSRDLIVPAAFHDEIHLNLHTPAEAENLPQRAAELLRDDNDRKIAALEERPVGGPRALADLRDLTAELSFDPHITAPQLERLMMRSQVVINPDNAGKHDARVIAVRLADRLQHSEPHRFSPLARWAVAEALFKILRSSSSMNRDDAVLHAAALGIAQTGLGDGALAAELMRMALPILKNTRDVARACALAVPLSNAFIHQPELLGSSEARYARELIADLAENSELDRTEQAKLLVYLLHEHNTGQRLLPLQDIQRIAEVLQTFAAAAPLEQRTELTPRIEALSRMALKRLPPD